MPRLFLLALIPFLFSATLYGQEAKKPSPAVKRILDEAVRAVKKNRVDFDKANQKPLGEARKALEDLSKKLIEDGKAEEATAVLRQVGNLEADVMRMANAPPPMVGGGQQKPSPVGKWSWPDGGTIQLNADGTASGSWHSEKGLWTIGPDNKIRMMVAKGRSVFEAQVAPDGQAMAIASIGIGRRIP
jgi:hypothetical protein